MSSDPRLSLLTSRRSTPSRLLGPPGPTEAELQALVEAAACVPDHGRLRPWRILLLRQSAGAALGNALVDLRTTRGEVLEEAVKDKDRHRFDRAPVVLVLISTVQREHKIPVVEQQYSAAAFAQNLLIATHALGFGAQWLTGWPAYDPAVMHLLGLTATETFHPRSESIVGFIHVGTPQGPAPQFDRPGYADLVQEWQPA
jgi:nitroreductase